ECRGLRGNSCPTPVLGSVASCAAVTRVSRKVYCPRNCKKDTCERALSSTPCARLASRLIQVEGCGGGRNVNTIKSRNRLPKNVASATRRDLHKCCSIPASILSERSGLRLRFPR